MSDVVAKWLSVVAVVLVILVDVVGGALTPGYSPSAQYISELGAQGSAVGQLVSYAGFLPIGVATLVALVLRFFSGPDKSLRPSIMVFLTLPAAYIGAAFARCNAGCVGFNTAQIVHNTVGLAEYLGGSLALVMAGYAFIRARRFITGIILLVSAIAVFLCLSAMGAPPPARFHGTAQRIAEVILFGFLLLLVWHRPWSQPGNSAGQR